MGQPSHTAQQMAVHMVLGFIPVVKVRQAVPVEGFSWDWGRWRMARLSEVVALNASIMRTWKP